MLYLDNVLLYIREFIAAVGVFIITYASARAAIQLFRLVRGINITTSYIRIQYGTAIILGLEFMVAADIVESMVEPDYYKMGLLAGLVVVRTFLSYFLGLELADLTPQEKLEIRKG